MISRTSLILLFWLCILWCSGPALAHDVSPHLDPELLSGWRTWIHLTIQWAHLVAFALWLGLTAGVLLLGIESRIDHLLYGSWILFLVSLATGTYNMEWSGGISETPSIFLLPLLDKIPYGITYTVVLAAKWALYVLAVLLTLVITALHLGRRVGEEKLRRVFLTTGTALAFLIALATSVVLFYHEVADLWPTPIHSLGRVVGSEAPLARGTANPEVPNDYAMLATRDAWIDIGLRWLHLLGFGLWLGGSAWVLVFGGVSTGRYLVFLWALLIIQVLSGIATMNRWTPFYLAPYVWNLSQLSEVRFGRSYTLFMAAKHLMVVGGLAFLIFWTIRCLWNKGIKHLSLQPLAGVSLLLGLTIGYIMMIVLLLHEGVDHSL